MAESSKRNKKGTEAMKQRILVAIIGIPLLLLVLCWLPHWATAALLAALGVMAPTNCWRR